MAADLSAQQAPAGPKTPVLSPCSGQNIAGRKNNAASFPDETTFEPSASGPKPTIQTFTSAPASKNTMEETGVAKAALETGLRRRKHWLGVLGRRSPPATGHTTERPAGL